MIKIKCTVKERYPILKCCFFLERRNQPSKYAEFEVSLIHPARIGANFKYGLMFVRKEEIINDNELNFLIHKSETIKLLKDIIIQIYPLDENEILWQLNKLSSIISEDSIQNEFNIEFKG